MKPSNRTVGIRLRLVLAPGIALGPGKADLLQGIKETGSIAAAGRRMRMSYKRAWQLVEMLNEAFSAPVVAAAKGGAKGGGAELTGLGEEVLALYRRMEARAARGAQSDLATLQARLARSREPGPAAGA